MNKKIIAAAIAASFVAAPAIADNHVTVYGKVKQSLDMVDITGGADEWQINDRNTRIGLKGSEDLGDGLKAIFQIEFNTRASTTGTGGPHIGGSANVAANRNTFVGLAGDFGTVLVGRHDTPHNMSVNKNNIFNDTAADLKDGRNPASPFNWERIDGTIAYVSPSFSGLTAAVAIVPDETQYNATGGDGLADHWSGALMYNNAGLYAGLGYLSLDTPGTALDEWNLAVNYKMDAFRIGATYEEAERGINNDMETWVLHGTYTMGNNVLKAQWYDSDCDTPLCGSDSWAIGLDHNFSKRTQAQLVYVDVDADANSADADGSVFSIQMNHSF
jgi:predicted porin